MDDLIVASRNAGKIAELAALLSGLDLRLISLQQAGVTDEAPETGDTFTANAVEKAEYVCRQTGRAALADDSGLCVDALGGAPGVYSARFGGPGLTDADRVQRLLAALVGVPAERRQARFACVLALARPGRATLTVDGQVEGSIAAAPAGAGGFGYDPIFYLPERGQTMAEAPPEVKNAISHRARAARAMHDLIHRLRDAGAW
ncbi:MAG: XTP/dITP diphosphatase [Chloroflexi bacterium]|nr:XTP/dITP diphosphatase [Chloroflexota bacterium]